MSADWTIDVPENELDTLAALTTAWAPDEQAGFGVWLEVVDGRRVWTAQSGPVVFRFRGGPSDQPAAPVSLPVRLLWWAVRMSGATGACTIGVRDGEVAIAEAGGRSIVIDLESGPCDPPAIQDGPTAATATMTAEDLRALVWESCVKAPGTDTDHGMPPPILSVEPGVVVAAIDWTPHDGLRTTLRQACTTTGAARVSVPTSLVREAVLALPDGEVVLRFPAGADQPLQVDGTDLTLILPCRRPGPDQEHLARQVWSILDDMVDEPFDAVDLHVFVGVVGGRELRVEVHDLGGRSVVRCSTVVVRDVTSGDDLLRRINDANAGLAGIRLWLDEDRVVAATDVPSSMIIALPETLESMAEQLHGFDVYLGAMA
jgi:hypothetical protein